MYNMQTTGFLQRKKKNERDKKIKEIIHKNFHIFKDMYWKGHHMPCTMGETSPRPLAPKTHLYEILGHWWHKDDSLLQVSRQETMKSHVREQESTWFQTPQQRNTFKIVQENDF